MKLRLTILPLFTLGLATATFAQQAKLAGRVFNHQNRSVPGITLFAPGGQAAKTSTNGNFSISFPASTRSGLPTRIMLRQPSNWVILQPMFGDCVTQSVENFEPMRVVIAPKGSPLALAPDRLDKVIAQWAKERDQLKQELDDYAFLRRYAKEYGFSWVQLRSAVERWAQFQASDDVERRALKEYWRKNYGRAAQLAKESAQAADKELPRAINAVAEVRLKIIRRNQLVGDSYYADYNFVEALQSYSAIERRIEAGEFSKNEFAREWAELKLAIGRTKRALGETVLGEAGPRLLLEALAAYDEAATYYTREQSPPHWALMQNNRGHTLLALSERYEGAEGAAYLKDAAAAFRGALEVFTCARWPLEWAATQNSLGTVLRESGSRMEGVERVNYLNEAADIHRAVLDGDLRARSPREWAGAQNNLSLALTDLSDQVAGAESVKYLDEAASALRAALKIFTRAKSPQDWSLAQNNLGVVLEKLGEQKEGSERLKLLNEAAAAYRAALTVRTREQLPQQWGQAQYNLSDVLRKIGKMTEDTMGLEYLNEAAAGLRAVLEVRTRAHSPQKWAMTQNTLGITLRALAERAQGKERIKYLDEAAVAHRAALEVHTRAQFPKDWAAAQANLADLLFDLGLKTEGPMGVEYLNGAAAKYRAALEVLTRAVSPQAWAYTQESLGVLLGVLGERVEGRERIKYWNEAVVALRSALEIFTPTQLPRKRAEVQKYLVAIYVSLEDWPHAAEAIEQVLRAFPNDQEMNRLGAAIYHDKLFNFERAFALHRSLAKGNNDAESQAGFAETHFTTARFVEAGQRISGLLEKQGLHASSAAALRALEIANLLALGWSNQVPDRLGALIAEVSRQPAEFKVGWSFAGARYFIAHSEKLSPYLAWLERLLNAVASEDRASMLKALQEVQAEFKK